jgi:corrinoid protein of di/trimethylamine methyltransferase
MSEQLQKGKAKIVKELVQNALDEGLAPQQILDEGLLSGMSIIGEKFKNNEVFVPEVMVAARAMNMGAEILKPHMVSDSANVKGTVVIGTVKGDLHDIGKNLVRMMIECKGINVIDLGVDVSPEAYLNAALENNADIIACSALLTTTMNEMSNVVTLLKERGLKDKFKVMVGGSPVNQSFCDTIGADAYTPDAVSAAEKIMQLLS